MMKKLNILLASIITMLYMTPAGAQKGRHKITQAKATPTVKAEEQDNNELYNTLLPATAKIMFVDSVVVGKHDFLAHIPLKRQSGTLSLTKGKFGVYVNGFGDRCLYANGDSVSRGIYDKILLGQHWGMPSQIKAIAAPDFIHPNFPFLSADGVTLYFSAEGPESMGGYDIFMTTYDNDKGTWYKPQNYGLPFNSPANDYLLAIDDIDSLGWLVSDRYQPQDSVCIYTFVPTATRRDFTTDNLSNEELRHYADISSIKSTWKFGNRKAALQRQEQMLQREMQTTQTEIPVFVINDLILISSPTQLKSERSRRLYAQWLEINKMIQQTSIELDNLRQEYHKESTARQQQLAGRILNNEERFLQLQTDKSSLEKQIRKIELN